MLRSGRRPGNQDTRDAILNAAREAFADRGFDGASIRSIATAAGVDPALVHHYFGTKDQLFLDTVQAPIDPAELIGGVLGEGLGNAGERLVRTMLGVWDGPAGGAAAGGVLWGSGGRAFHDAVRFGDIRAGDAIARLVADVDCVVGRLALQHARAFVAGDAAQLSAVSAAFADIGMMAAADDAAKQAEAAR